MHTWPSREAAGRAPSSWAGGICCGLTICPAYAPPGPAAGGLPLPHLHFSWPSGPPHPIPFLVESMMGWTTQKTVWLPPAGGGQLRGGHQAEERGRQEPGPRSDLLTPIRIQALQ